jgi:membrane associated rhomboid family serine protease
MFCPNPAKREPVNKQNQKNTMVQRKTAIITALILIHLLGAESVQVAASASSEWYTHLIYMFFHGNILHLSLNCYALWHCFSRWKFMLAAYIISVVSSFFIADLVVGFSGTICALWGMTILRLNKSGWIQMIAVFTLSFFIPSISWQIHLICFILGTAYILIMRLNNDYRKVTHRK